QRRQLLPPLPPRGVQLVPRPVDDLVRRRYAEDRRHARYPGVEIGQEPHRRRVAVDDVAELRIESINSLPRPDEPPDREAEPDELALQTARSLDELGHEFL